MTRRVVGRKRIIARKTTASAAASGVAKGSRKPVGTRGHGTRTADVVHAHLEGQKGMRRCPNCGAMYFDKHWHSPEALTWDKTSMYVHPVAEQLCGECKAGKLSPGGVPSAYAGEIIVEGTWTPEERFMLLQTVRNAGKRAMRRDPQDRIVRILEERGVIRIFTSENQLAVAIGKQLHSSRKGGELHVTWSSDDKPVRVHWKKG